MNRNKFRFIKTHKIMTFIVAIILTLTIGYAIFSESINILGLASTGSGNFNIVFDRVGQIEEHEATGTSANIVDAGKKLEIKVEHLKMPSSYVEIPVVVKNKGDITAKVKEIKTNGLDTTDIKVTYEGLLLEDVLNPNDERNLKITVTWDMSSVNPNVVADFTIEIVYEQVVNGSVTTSTPTEIDDNRFIYEGTKLIGLSAEGEEYFSSPKDLIIPEGTTEIGDGAFVIPYGSAETIPDFKYLGKYLHYSFEEEVINGFGELYPHYKLDPEYSEVEFNKHLSSLNKIVNNGQKLRIFNNVVIPSSVVKIGALAFSYVTIKNGGLIIPDSVTEIGDGAFYYTLIDGGGLKISNNLKKISKNAFAGAKILNPTKIVIPDSVVEIGDRAFFNFMCGDGVTTSRHTLQLSKNLSKVGNMAFYTGYFEGDLIMYDSITEIGFYSFATTFNGKINISKNLKVIPLYEFSTANFKGEIYIPDSVEDIEFSAFYDSINATSVSLTKNLYDKIFIDGTDKYAVLPAGVSINIR